MESILNIINRHCKTFTLQYAIKKVYMRVFPKLVFQKPCRFLLAVSKYIYRILSI